MKTARLFSIAIAPLVTACVATKVDVPRDHPANPAAPVAPVALTPALVTTPASPETLPPAGHQHETARVWTCPMHPEIAESGPGPCPICGMKLVKRAPEEGK